MTARVMMALLIKRRGKRRELESALFFPRRSRARARRRSVASGVDLKDASRPAGYYFITDNYRRSFRKRSALHPPVPGLLGRGTGRHIAITVFAASLRAVGPVRPRAQTGSAAPAQVRFLSDERKFVQKAHRFAQPINRSPRAIRAARLKRNLTDTRRKSKHNRDSIVYVQITGESPLPELTERYECSGERIFV